MRTFVLKCGHENHLPTANESYIDGYETGSTWDRFAPHNNYVPGGPWVCGVESHMKRHADPAFLEYCEATAENNREWRRGWFDGRAARKADPLPIEHVAVLGYN